MMPPLRKQRGAVTLMGALVIIITMMLMIEVLHRMAGSDILDTAAQNEAVEALFIAETGIEHASYLFANGTACADLALVGPVNAGRGSFDIGPSTLVGSECSVSVTATAGVLGAQRVVEAVLKNGGNLLGDANSGFDEPAGACDPSLGCTPTGWTLPAGGWQDLGGPTASSGPPIVYDRAAYVIKPIPGPSTATTAGSFGLTPFTVTAPATLTLSFDYKVVTSGGSSKEAELSFALTDGTSTYGSTPAPLESGHTGNYVTGNVTIAIGGSGPVTITGFSFTLFAKAGQPKQIWLDNLDLRDPAGGGSVALRQWREIVSN
jgi:hypothetical protein